MLAYFLALAVGLGSFAIYMAAFFFPEIHRKNDFIWSGVGLFYALVLWVFARRITGGLLLGHIASVALLGSFGWQTLSLRRQLTPQAQQTPVPSADAVKSTVQEQVTKLSLPQRLAQLQQGLGSAFGGVKNKVQQSVGKKTPPQPTPTKPPKTTSKPAVEIINNVSNVSAIAEPTEPTEAVATNVIETTPISEQPTQLVVTTDTEATTPTSEQPTEVIATTATETTIAVVEVIPADTPVSEVTDAVSSEEKTPSPSQGSLPNVQVTPQTPPPNTSEG
ncbi:MAG: Ycf66 family protein [Heteroscytonema crispum UTEX LB 1556]